MAAILLLLALAVCQLCMPGRDFSDLENRTLSRMSAPTEEGALSGRWMRSAEAAVADQFPFRELWISLQALEDAGMLRNQRNGILIGRGGWLFEPVKNLSTRTARANIGAMNKLAAYAGVPVTLMLVPMSSAVYPNALPFGYLADDQGSLLESLYGETENVQTIRLLEAMLAEEGEEPLFFRTDHHWTVAGMKVAYDALRKAWRLPAAESRVERFSLGNSHFGSYYARSPNPFIRPDGFTLEFPGGISMEIEGERQNGLFDSGAMEASRDKYARLLYGNHGMISLTGGAGEGVLLVIKDSYANLLLPWLALHYERVEAVDLRYFSGDLGPWIQERDGAAGILCVFGLTTWLNDRNLPRRVALWET